MNSDFQDRHDSASPIAPRDLQHSCRALGLAICALLAGCGVDEMRWKEQVYLHDGTLIEVDRHATAEASGFPDARRGRVLTEELRYAPLKVMWSMGDSGEQLVSFDVVKGVAYLIVNPGGQNEQFCIGKAPGEYIAVYYRWINGKQEKISRAETPLEIMRWNLSGISHWGSDSRSDPTYLSWQDVVNSNSEDSYKPPIMMTQMFQQKSWLRCK